MDEGGRHQQRRRPPVFDGHNDTLTHIHHGGVRSFLERSDTGHIDLPRARQGGLGGGFFAVFTSSPGWAMTRLPVLDDDGEPRAGHYRVALPPMLDRRDALDFTLGIFSDLYRLVAESADPIEVVTSARQLERCLDEGIFAVILHIEGAEAVDPDLQALDVFYEAGLRSLGPVWSRPNVFGRGVPFDFPAGPDIGPGLTDAGKELIRRCNALGIMVDLSHLNERGFDDVAAISGAPLVATHSNAHRLSPTPRNLTDRQLDVIAQTDGIVGLNYAVGFLREDGRSDPATPVSRIAEHARYIADRIGVDHLALGSDFDGALIPSGIGDVTGIPALLDELEAAGFVEDEIIRIAYGNWVRVLDATWRRDE